MKQNISVDNFTFGDSRAAIYLADLLNKEENKKYSRRVSCFLSKYLHFLNQIDLTSDILDLTTRQALIQMVRNDFIKQLDNKVNGFFLPDRIKSLVRNIFIKNYRAALNGDKERNDFLRKQIKQELT